jgi:Na+/H+ antiporter NhaD/arsenite permease-like protein
VSTDITRLLSALTKRTTDEISKAATIAARVNVWASSDVIDAEPTLAAMRAAPPHHARHTLRFELHLVYVGACMRQAAI